MRLIKSEDLQGKTIKKVDITAVNHLVLYFVDDTSISLWADDAVATQYGSIPGIFVSGDK